jgi:hypothetical protein
MNAAANERVRAEAERVAAANKQPPTMVVPRTHLLLSLQLSRLLLFFRTPR